MNPVPTLEEEGDDWEPIHSVMNPVPTLEEEKGDDGNHIHSVINSVPTLEEEKGDDGEPHTFSNESSSYTGRRKVR
jgi:hypothetical protein